MRHCLGLSYSILEVDRGLIVRSTSRIEAVSQTYLNCFMLLRISATRGFLADGDQDHPISRVPGSIELSNISCLTRSGSSCEG